MQNNDIQVFDTDQLQELLRLNELFVDKNLLITLPNVCARNSCVVAISAGGNPIKCDHNTRWLKLAEQQGLATLVDIQCLYPDNLAAADWPSLDIAALVDKIGKLSNNCSSSALLVFSTVNRLYSWEGGHSCMQRVYLTSFMSHISDQKHVIPEII